MAMARSSSVPDSDPAVRVSVGSDPGLAVRFQAVTKRYDRVTAVDALSFDVAPGEMFGLIGPDGAGKTTTIRLIGGLLKPDGGSIRVFGRDPVADHRAITSDVGYL